MWDSKTEALFQSLRNWRTEQARPTKTPAFLILADAVLRAIATRCPQNLTELTAIPGMGPAKVDKYGPDLIALCRGIATSSDTKSAQPTNTASERQRRDSYQPGAQPQDHVQEENQRAESPTHRPATTPRALNQQMPSRVGQSLSAVRQNKPTPPPPPPTDLTPAQLALETRLKDWRRDEARTAGLPSFFILSDTLVRSIAQASPQSFADLSTIRGLPIDKIDRFGAALLTVCRPS